MPFGLDLNGVELQQNVANVSTPILVYTVPAGAKVNWPVITGIIMKLYDTNGNELSKKDELYFAYKLPADKTWTPLTEVFTYHKFAVMDISEQSDQTRTPTVSLSSAAIAAMKAVNPDATIIQFTKDRQIALFLKSAATFDPTNDNNFLELRDVEVEA